jgi:hypothetical protein
MYVVESYAANRPGRLEETRERARLAEEVGANVEYVRTTFLPEDEVVLHMFTAVSEESLREAADLAGLVHERIVEAVERLAEPPSGDEGKA